MSTPLTDAEILIAAREAHRTAQIIEKQCHRLRDLLDRKVQHATYLRAEGSRLLQSLWLSEGERFAMKITK